MCYRRFFFYCLNLKIKFISLKKDGKIAPKQGIRMLVKEVAHSKTDINIKNSCLSTTN